MFAQYTRDRPATNVMPQVRQRALNSRIAPRSILQRHANDELDDYLDRSWPPGSTAVGIDPFLCDQRSIPPHQRVRRDQRVEFAERFASQRICSACESTASTAEPLLQQQIFLSQILDHIELLTIDPAGKQRQKKLKRLYGAKHPSKYGPFCSELRRSHCWTVRGRYPMGCRGDWPE